jgi:hypothetical protein
VLIAEKWNIMIFADFSSIQPKARNIYPPNLSCYMLIVVHKLQDLSNSEE